MWEQLGHGETIFKAGWPSYDESAMKDDEIEVPVQINGKTRAVISISADASKDEAIAAGKEAVADKLTGTIVKEIYVPKKIIKLIYISFQKTNSQYQKSPEAPKSIFR